MQGSVFTASPEASGGMITYTVQAVDQSTGAYSNVSTVTIFIQPCARSSLQILDCMATNVEAGIQDRTILHGISTSLISMIDAIRQSLRRSAFRSAVEQARSLCRLIDPQAGKYITGQTANSLREDCELVRHSILIDALQEAPNFQDRQDVVRKELPEGAKKVRVVSKTPSRHDIDSTRQVQLELRKVCFELNGREICWYFAIFPSFPPDWNPPPKALERNGTRTVGGRTFNAYDSNGGVQTGCPVLPGGGGLPPTNFSGYMKIIEICDIPKDCKVIFKQVLYPKLFIRPPGGPEFFDILKPPPPGGPRPDPPEGKLGIPTSEPGKFIMADFPHFSTNIAGPGQPAQSLPVSTHFLREARFRTWIVERCPQIADSVLGYYEWGFTALWHVTEPFTVEYVRVDAPEGPPGLPAPPGGWTNAPTTITPTFTPRVDAQPGPLADFRKAFP
jgi:hypothetical protein